MKVFNSQEIQEIISLDHQIISTIENTFTQLVTKDVQMPPIMRIDVFENNGEVDVKSAFIPGEDSFAIKISSGFFNNDQLGLPSGNGLMLLIDAKTGVPKALLLDNGYLTDIRTAAAGAVAAKFLANQSISVAGVIGVGSQARYQIRALKLVRNFSRLLVYGRSEEKVAKFIKDLSLEFNITIESVASPEAVVRQSDVVVTATPAKKPIIKAEWLHPGLHITAMGSDAEDKQELDSDVLVKADQVICDVKVQCQRLGELQHCQNDNVLDRVVELGQLTAGKVIGRKKEDDITICDLTGTGAQDTAIARYVFNKLDRN